MSRSTRLFSFLLLMCLKTNVAWSEGFFDGVNPNMLHDELIRQSRESSAIQNANYLKESIRAKVKLHSESESNKTQPIAGNSVVIGDGSTVNGDVIVNIQVDGDTYVAGR